MKIKSFENTGTFHLKLSDATIAETKEMNENLYADLDAEGKILSLTIEHAKASSRNFDFSYQTVAA